MALLLIDGKEFEVPDGQTVIQAALDHGIFIPHYCWHPHLSIAAQCRMCLVELQGFPKLVPACSTRVNPMPPQRKVDGKYDMVIATGTEKVKKTQEQMMALLLANHPLDCPICDQAGECLLQEYSYQYGDPQSHMKEERHHAPKRVELGPHVVYDAERCIKCTRCVRFCREIPKTAELSLVNRGVHAQIGAAPGQALDNPYSGCTVDICPVGALTSKEFRFRQRVWFLKRSSSVCTDCARVCSTWVDCNKGEIARITPRENENVNGSWMCDQGRLASERYRQANRPSLPAQRYGEELRPFSWEDIFSRLIESLANERGAWEKAGLLVVSGRCSLEEMAASKVWRDTFMPGAQMAVPNQIVGEDDEILIRAEKRPNMRGARLMGLSPDEDNTDWPTLLKGVKTLILVREDPLGDETDEKVQKKIASALSKVDRLVVLDDHFTQTAETANFFLPLAASFEMEGTWINFEGVVQKGLPANTDTLGRPRNVLPPVYNVDSVALDEWGMTPSTPSLPAQSSGRSLYHIVSAFLTSQEKECPGAKWKEWFALVKKDIPSLSKLGSRDLLPNGSKLQEGEARP